MSFLSDEHTHHLKNLAQAIRFLTIDAVEKAASGHPGMPLGMADVATVLFHHHMRFSPFVPDWPVRDRFVVSAGHGSMLLYSLFYLLGYPSVSLDMLRRFRQKNAPCAGHPEYGALPGIEATTGPLAQGLGSAVGMALAERMAVAREGEHLAHRTYVLCGDGCLMEGLSHEVASFAGHQRLGKLIVLFDDNHMTIDGSTSLSCSDDTSMRFQAYGWHVQSIDGHNPLAIHHALLKAQATDVPSLIACRTTIGYGAPQKAGTAEAHGSPLGADEIQAMRTRYDWPKNPFDVPPTLLKAWRERGEKAHADALNHSPKASLDVLPERTFSSQALSETDHHKLTDLLHTFQTLPCAMATRVASQKVLEVLHPLCPSWIGGSADLTPSNNTRIPWAQSIQPPDYQGHYIHYGVREHGMAAIMNGITLHGSFRAFGGTFLAFSDYLKPSLRLSAMMKLPVIYIFTHDSIGLGEDGPTHQPIEHLWALRAIPHLTVYRPADAIETAECWACAAQHTEGPSALILSRQSLQPVRQNIFQKWKDFPCARGGYILQDHPQASCVLIATGSEVALALETQSLLAAQGCLCRVVSMPCTSLFEAQDLAYRQSVIPPTWPAFAIEAGSPWGWTHYTRTLNHVFGITEFGLSAPAADLWEHFCFQAEPIASHIQKCLSLTKG